MGRDDALWMRRCFEAAILGRGRVSPNPMVGAVVVKGGRLLSRGFHSRYGGPHAEAAALRRAGPAARGATLYVSLEPCAHFGKTPPCTDALIRSGIRRVVAAVRDPNSRVNGRGFRALRRAGVQVQVGLLRREAVELNLAYMTAMKEGRPLVTLKAGMTLDGRIAAAGGASRWITSPASRRAAHRLRAAHDAVLVGIETLLEDAPRLNARGGGRSVRQPLRVILDTALRADPSLPLFRARGGGAVLVYTRSPRGARARRLRETGAEVVPAGRGPGGVSLRRVLADLVERGVHSLLVEGGGEVAWSFLAQGLADGVSWFVAPLILGGREAVPVVGGKGFSAPAAALRLEGLEVSRSGPDLRITGRIRPGRGARGGSRRGPGVLRRGGR